MSQLSNVLFAYAPIRSLCEGKFLNIHPICRLTCCPDVGQALPRSGSEKTVVEEEEEEDEEEEEEKPAALPAPLRAFSFGTKKVTAKPPQASCPHPKPCNPWHHLKPH